MPRKQAQTRAANSSALKKLVTQAVAPKKPRTPKQLAALQKAAATKKQKAQELSIRRGHDASLKAERQVWQEFLDIIAELAYDGSKFDKAKVMSEAMNDAMDHLEEQDPLFAVRCWATRDGSLLLIASESKETSEVRYVQRGDAGAGTPPRLVRPRAFGHRYPQAD